LPRLTTRPTTSAAIAEPITSTGPGLTTKYIAAAAVTSTAKMAAVRMTTSSSVIRPVWSGVAAGASYMLCRSVAVGVSNVAYPPRWNPRLLLNTGLRLSIGPSWDVGVVPWPARADQGARLPGSHLT
jgi:hypothetical protein